MVCVVCVLCVCVCVCLCQVFLKYYHVEQLNLMMRLTTERIVLVQAYVRGWLGAKRYKMILEKRNQSAMVLQSGEGSRGSREPAVR